MHLSSLVVMHGVSKNAAEISEVCLQTEKLTEDHLETIALAFDKMAKLVRDTKTHEFNNNHQTRSQNNHQKGIVP